MQYAGLPTVSADAPEPNATAQLNWLGEIPIAIGAKSALLQFDIEREPGEQQAEDGPGDIWTFRFSVDNDPDGPVHGKIALQGLQLSVALWAENASTAAAFLTGAERLKLVLADLGVEATEVTVHVGRPVDTQKRESMHHEVDAQT
jgi:hypothetical protein